MGGHSTGSGGAAALLVLLLVSLEAPAGTDVDSEVEDGQGDATYTDSGPTGVVGDLSSRAAPEYQQVQYNPPQRKALDVLRAYFTAPGDTSAEPAGSPPSAFRAVLKLRDLRAASEQDACVPCAWAVLWDWNGSTYAAYLVYRQGQATSGPTSRFAAGALKAAPPSFPFEELVPIHGTVERPEGADYVLVTMEVPVSVMPGAGPGAVLARTHAWSLYTNRTLTGSATGRDADERWHESDRAPNCVPAPKGCASFGRDWALPGGPSPPSPAPPRADEEHATDNASGALSEVLERTSAPPAGIEAASPPDLGPRPEHLLALAVGAAVVGGSVVTRTRRYRRLAQRVRAVQRGRSGPVGPERELDRIAREAAQAFGAGKLTGRGLRRLQADVARTRVTMASRAAAVAAAAGPAARTIVPGGGRYRILSDLPSGAFGRARIAEDTVLGRKVVIKQLHPLWRMDPRVRAAFLREARIAGQLNHPHIVTVHDVDTRHDAIIMEYVNGGNLEERLRSGPLPLPRALALADEILQGLQAVHARGIFHRDLKPANILLTKDGHAKIADFGIAHAPLDSATARFSATGHQPGTLLYMAPEQVLNEPPDARTDLYAVAAILHETLTGAHYLDGRTVRDFDLRRAIVEEPPHIDPRLPGPLAALVRKGLAKAREERFRDAAEMRRAIAEARRALGLERGAP